MLMSNMSSKRQRRPNVRLGEIGDVSAAFACGFSQRSRENLGENSWERDYLHSHEIYLNFKQNYPEFASSNHPSVCPRLTAEMQQNMENKNPNSLRSAFERGSSEEIDMSKSKLNFGNITRKRRGSRGNKNVFTIAQAFKNFPENDISNDDGEEFERKGIVGFAPNICDNLYPYNGFKDNLDHETSTMSKESFEDVMNEGSVDLWQHLNLCDLWKEGDRQEGNYIFPESRSGGDQIRFGGSNDNSVRDWLDELGLGKYAGLFEMHEVDKETLPYLTLEDLKEMGLLAVGTRRKLYSAIERLREQQDGTT